VFATFTMQLVLVNFTFITHTPMHKFRILIADDDQDDFLTITQAFEEQAIDCIIERAEDGQQLLKRLLSATRLAQNAPDLVLLDINMPKVNGLQALQQIRSMDEYKELPIVMHSTSSNPDLVSNCIARGAAGYAVKGISYKSTLQLVDNIVNFLTYGTKFPPYNSLKSNKLLI
jgi:CheY-like chemotaxis protein